MKNKNHITNEVTPEAKRSLKVRVITSIIGLAIVLPCLFIGGWTYFVLIAFATIVAGYEIVHCAKRKYNIALYICAILLVLLFAVFPILQNLSQPNALENFQVWTGFSKICVSSFLILIAIIFCFSMVLIDKNFEVRDASYMFAFCVLVGLGMQCLLYLRYVPLYENSLAENPINSSWYDHLSSALLLILVVGGSLMSDTGAYFAGMLFGKNKMNERISPKKTWEGFVGGIVLSMIFTLSLGYGMAAAGRPILNILTTSGYQWVYLLIISIIIPLVSPLGDFIFSSVKRYYNIKDFGNILPGHGGVLDRVDSVLFAAIASSILIIVFTAIEEGSWENILF